MRKLRAIAAGVLAALWVVVSAHCLLEQVPAFGFLRCEAPASSDNTPGSHCDDQTCLTLESGGYVSASHARTPVAVLGAVLNLISLSECPLAVDSSEQVLITSVPPDVLKSWQFSLRTAAPPRAPSFVS